MAEQKMSDNVYGRTKDEWQCENDIKLLERTTWEPMELSSNLQLQPSKHWNHLRAIARIWQSGRSLYETTLAPMEIFELPSNQLQYSAVAVGDCTHHFVYALGPFPNILTCKPSCRTPHLIVIRILRLARTLEFATQSRSSSLKFLYQSDYDLVPGE
jgi:hypothetical protein